MKVFTAVANTESGDTYVFVYRNKPTDCDVSKMIFEIEGSDEELGLDWYLDTTNISIEETEVIENESQ